MAPARRRLLLGPFGAALSDATANYATDERQRMTRSLCYRGRPPMRRALVRAQACFDGVLAAAPCARYDRLRRVQTCLVRRSSKQAAGHAASAELGVATGRGFDSKARRAAARARCCSMLPTAPLRGRVQSVTFSSSHSALTRMRKQVCASSRTRKFQRALLARFNTASARAFDIIQHTAPPPNRMSSVRAVSCTPRCACKAGWQTASAPGARPAGRRPKIRACISSGAFTGCDGAEAGRSSSVRRASASSAGLRSGASTGGCGLSTALAVAGITSTAAGATIAQASEGGGSAAGEAPKGSSRAGTRRGGDTERAASAAGGAGGAAGAGAAGRWPKMGAIPGGKAAAGGASCTASHARRTSTPQRRCHMQ